MRCHAQSKQQHTRHAMRCSNACHLSRGSETYGEDPYLMSRMAVAVVRGLQGDHPRYVKVRHGWVGSPGA